MYLFAIHKTWKLGPSSSVDNDDDDHTGSDGGVNDNDYDDDDNACEKDGSVEEKYESEKGFGFKLSPQMKTPWTLPAEVGQGRNLKVCNNFPVKASMQCLTSYNGGLTSYNGGSRWAGIWENGETVTDCSWKESKSFYLLSHPDPTPEKNQNNLPHILSNPDSHINLPVGVGDVHFS